MEPMQLMDDLDALDLAIDGFGERLALVGDRWTVPTPCDDWDVRWLCADEAVINRLTTSIGERTAWEIREDMRDRAAAGGRGIER